MNRTKNNMKPMKLLHTMRVMTSLAPQEQGDPQAQQGTLEEKIDPILVMDRITGETPQMIAE